MTNLIRYFYLIPREIRRTFYVPYNKLILYINNVNYGNNCRLYNKIHILIHKNSIVDIGDNFKFVSGDGYNPLIRNIWGSIYVARKGKLYIGNNVGMSSTIIRCAKYIKIGNNVKIGGDSLIIDTDGHSLNYIERRESNKDIAKTSAIVIEDDVLIGTRSIILKGVTIGARSIIGSGSVVTKSIPSDCIAAGNPCKVIRYINNGIN